MENRKTLTVTLETVTPMFLRGAEPRGEPELRPPAFRGALRYWLRAALGGVVGDNNLTGLHELESAVFGSADYGSPISIRLQGSLRSSDEKILPHKEGKFASPRKAFSAGQSIDLILSQRRSNDDTIWRSACSALNLALTFGGMGLRSRRGYGTLKIVQSSNPILVPSAPATLENWRQHVKNMVEKATATTRELAQSQEVPLADLPSGPARYPCATHKGLIRLCNLQAASASAAVRQFMEHASGDYAFGGIKPRRQASPLWVRSIQLGNQYGLLLTVLASQFNGANYPAVQKFLDEKFKGEDVSVKGWNA